MNQISESPIPISIARTAEERERVFSFRYSIYVEEMGKRLGDADHAKRQLRDALDDTATIYYAEHDGRIVATLRTYFGADAPPPASYREKYALHRFAPYPDSALSFSSRLMVSRDLRGTALLGQLLLQGYAAARARGVLFDFCECTPALIGLYEHLGYRRYKDNFFDEENGYCIPMVLLIGDSERLRCVRSPLARALPAGELAPPGEEVAWFEREFPASWDVGEWGLTDEDFWRLLHRKLLPQESLLFQGLSEDEGRALLSGGALLRCKKGDQLIREGDPHKELYVVLSGMFEVRLPGEALALAVLGPGQTLGEVAMLVGCRRSAHAVAMADSEALVISQRFLERLKERNPVLAAKVLHNLSRILGERLIFTSRRRLPARTSTPPASAAGSYDFGRMQDRAAELGRLGQQADAAWAFEERLLRGAGLLPGMRVLDLACGPGHLSRRLAQLVGPGGSVTGVDLSAELLAAAQAETQQPGAAPLRFLRGDAYALDLPEASFDFVYARFLFQHLSEPGRALREIVRVLRPGGRLCVVDVDDAILGLWPEAPTFQRLVELAGAGQRRRGGDRQVGRKLLWYLRLAGLGEVTAKVQILTSDDLGMGAFVEITSGFKVESAAVEEREEAARCLEAVRRQAAAPGAFGMVGVYVVTGVRP